MVYTHINVSEIYAKEARENVNHKLKCLTFSKQNIQQCIRS